ncbi:MAG TPA: hypothetical protein VHY20_08520, partial [Pirellulales bacterium]|nr:hypothetical protein [Pirellulales bacterium]
MSRRRLQIAIMLIGLAAVSAVLAGRYLSAAEPAAEPAPPALADLKPGQTAEMFDGKTLTGWKESDFPGHGD